MGWTTITFQSTSMVVIIPVIALPVVLGIVVAVLAGAACGVEHVEEAMQHGGKQDVQC